MLDNDTTTIRASPTVATQWYKHHFHKAYVKKSKLMVGSYMCCVHKIASYVFKKPNNLLILPYKFS